MVVRSLIKRGKIFLLFLTVVCILLLGIYKVYIQNDKNDCVRNIQMYFEYMNRKDFDKFNEIVTSNLQINDELEKENINNNLLLVEMLSIEQVKDKEGIFKVKYRRIWDEKFIATGSEEPGENIEDVLIYSIKENNKWHINELEY